MKAFKNKLIYLACPYTHKNKDIRSMRSQIATIVSGKLIKKRVFNFSPLTLQIPLEEAMEFPHTWEYWGEMDYMFVDRCDEVWIIAIEGWEESVGVTEEAEFAKKQGKTVRYLIPDGELLKLSSGPSLKDIDIEFNINIFESNKTAA